MAEGVGNRLKIQLRNLNARMINFDDLRFYSWNRAEAFQPPPLAYELVASTEGCVTKAEAAWGFPHVTYPHMFGDFDGLAGAAAVGEHAALASVYGLEVIDNKWLFERGFNCERLLGTHPLNRRTPSKLLINTIDDSLRYVVLPHHVGNGSRIELWADGIQIHSADISGATAWIDRTVALPAGTRQVTLQHHATGWQLEHLYWQYLGPADLTRLAAVPAAAPTKAVAQRTPAPPRNSTVSQPKPRKDPVPAKPAAPPEPVAASPMPRYWHMRIEPISAAVPIDAGLRAFWDKGVYVYLRSDQQVGFNPDNPSPYFYQGRKLWAAKDDTLSFDLDGMRYRVALPDRYAPDKTLTTVDENGQQFRMLLVPKQEGER